MIIFKEKIIVLEWALLKPKVRLSKQELSRLLADDFLEIPSIGIPYNKSYALNRIPKEASPEFTLKDFTLRLLSENLVQLINKANIKRKNAETITYSQCSSILKQTG